VLIACVLLAAVMPSASAQAGGEVAAWTALRQPGSIVLFRHATAPGVGDPPGMRLDDCATQRNLNDQGRQEARQLGAAFRARGVVVGQVLNSRWCRARETARLAFAQASAGGVRDEPAFDSFFREQGQADAQTARALALLRQWQGPGALVVVTHQVNIQALTGINTASAEGLVVQVPGGNGPLRVLGRVAP
jgi:phosphohistidine phosphatase SixA